MATEDRAIDFAIEGRPIAMRHGNNRRWRRSTKSHEERICRGGWLGRSQIAQGERQRGWLLARLPGDPKSKSASQDGANGAGADLA